MKQLTKSELTQLTKHYDRSTVFTNERAAISFAAQVNGHVRKTPNEYWVFWRKE